MSEQKVVREKWGRSIAEDMLKKQHDLNVFLSGAIDAEVIYKDMNMSHESETIDRFDWGYDADNFVEGITLKMEKSDTGDWVKYTDHTAAIKELVEELNAWRELALGEMSHMSNKSWFVETDRLIKKYGGNT